MFFEAVARSHVELLDRRDLNILSKFLLAYIPCVHAGLLCTWQNATNDKRIQIHAVKTAKIIIIKSFNKGLWKKFRESRLIANVSSWRFGLRHYKLFRRSVVCRGL